MLYCLVTLNCDVVLYKMFIVKRLNLATNHLAPTFWGSESMISTQKMYDLMRDALVGAQAHIVNEKLVGRSYLITNQVESFLKGNRLLDFGCGDGQVGDELSARFVVASYDVADYRLKKSGYFTNSWADLSSQRFDSALAVTVFHHCDDPDLEIERLRNITQRLVVIESVINSSMPWEIQALVDWIYNRGLHPRASIPVPGNFRTIVGWMETFTRHGFVITHTEDFGIDLPIVPEHHVLFVLDRKT